jgi:hypothetical protein
VATGNVRNAELITLFTRLLPRLEVAFSEADRIDLSTAGLTLHARPKR